ncbi:hypothetical protein ACJRO7_034205 [Eucalyptus globulus]|uniref:Mannan endo-1,4-beta-mannosidase n=1 Tax=Eucalyptus globulus TaxID=34317 RepID=A0ABD3JBT5_EUCGL
MAHCYCHPFVTLCSLCMFLPLILAVNLGNWLVTEGWMMPSLFDGLNGQLLDGTQVQFQSTKLRKFLSADHSGRATIVANRDQASGWETFRLWRISDTKFNLRVFNKQFVGLQGQGTTVVAVSSTPSISETFDIVRNPNNPNRVFEMNIVGVLQGEYQITNGYGPSAASKLLQDHWNSYITKQDFEFMAANGLTAVRIPVGWWTAYDPVPPMPFVGGSLNALDNAFTWAAKHGLKVTVNLHAAPGSQNGESHSASRDGYLEWGDSYIEDTVKVIDFLAARYGNHPALVAIELMNEPLAPGVKLEDLTKYYRLGYDAVRSHTLNAYVIMSNRLGPLLQLAEGLSRVVIDVHYYNLYNPMFQQWNLQQNSDYIYNNRASDLSKVTPANGPLSFVGEWTSVLDFKGATMEDSGSFAKAQQDVYGRATFGWSYWSYKCQYDGWNLQQLIQDGLIQI